jgi:hypothetical protein
MEELVHLADLIRIRNFVNSSVSRIINHPAEVGHIAEYLMGEIFQLKLHDSANTRASDGVFREGPLQGRTVNVKFRAAQQRKLNLEEFIDPLKHADFYLAVHGPRSASKRSKGRELPFLIEAVYLFESAALIPQIAKPEHDTVGKSVPTALWQAAMIYPVQVNQTLILTPEQRTALALFAPAS